MKKVYFLLPDGRIKPSLLFLAIETFEMANQYLIDRGDKPYYEIKIAGYDLSEDVWNSHVHIRVETISTAESPDLIIVPGGSQKNDYSTKGNKDITNWITEQYRNGAELASLCTGSFLLAATGLLNNMQCTTHWKMGNLFMEKYPRIKFCSDKIITECKGIYTASGMLSSMNLVLYIIEKYNGRQVAVYCAKMMHIDMDRSSQSAFVIFEGQKEHDDDAIKKIQTFIEGNISDKITVDLLADKFSIPKRSLIRRFKKATHNLPIEYIQRAKIEAAKRKLEADRKSISEIMHEVGYTDTKAFRNIFRKIAGLSPIEYRRKYNKDFVS